MFPAMHGNFRRMSAGQGGPVQFAVESRHRSQFKPNVLYRTFPIHVERVAACRLPHVLRSGVRYVRRRLSTA